MLLFAQQQLLLQETKNTFTSTDNESKYSDMIKETERIQDLKNKFNGQRLVHFSSPTRQELLDDEGRRMCIET